MGYARNDRNAEQDEPMVIDGALSNLETIDTFNDVLMCQVASGSHDWPSIARVFENAGLGLARHRECR
jgi:hypothetical protein